jgi:hypothetical protein
VPPLPCFCPGRGIHEGVERLITEWDSEKEWEVAVLFLKEKDLIDAYRSFREAFFKEESQ